MSLCKHPEEVCCSLTIYHGEVYCDNTNGFCQLHDEPPPETNADHIRSMPDEELAAFLEEVGYDSMEHRSTYWLNWLKQPYKEDME